MSLSNRVVQKFNVGEKCQTFQAAFLQFIQTHNNMATVNEIKYDVLKEKLDSRDVTLVDVREPEELKDQGKIPGSVNIPAGQIEEAFSLPPEIFESKYGFKLPDPESSNLVLSCKAGRRAAVAYHKIARFGYSNALVYYGSFQEWIEKGGPLEKP